jgi:hypothetical protein
VTPTEAAPFPTENQRPDLQPAENNEAEKKVKPRTKQIQNKNKQIREPERKKLKPTALCIFGLLQVTVTLTVGIGKQRGRRHSKSPGFLEFPAAAREPTRRHYFCGPEGLPCNSWSFRGYFANFKLFHVIFFV